MQSGIFHRLKDTLSQPNLIPLKNELTINDLKEGKAKTRKQNYFYIKL